MSVQETPRSSKGPPLEDTFKILIATDNHLGYDEKNTVKGQDSFITFEEILGQADKNDVDFVLLGGDLFHESKPSPYCINKCLELLRKYCLNDKPVQIEFLSDQSCNFQFQFQPTVNYEDPNLNIGIPVFSIHGNHDDPIGHKNTSAMDILASTGFVNYFGKCIDLANIEIRPLLLQKGTTKLAIYGLSHIRDERLGRLFLEKKVHFKKPAEDDWFNILVLHQNRVARGVKNFIPDSFIPDFIDLVIWGHEHDCRIEPERMDNGVYISQPGSSVATSLSAGESLKKHIGLLKVYKKEFKMVPIPLKTIRPFIIDEFCLENPKSATYSVEKPGEQAIKQVKKKIEEMIQKATSMHEGPGVPLLPLIRLKVFYYEEQQQFNPIRIGMQFAKHVANPVDIIKLNSYIAKEKRAKCNINFQDEDLDLNDDPTESLQTVEDVVRRVFQKDEYKDTLTVLSLQGLLEGVSRLVTSDDSESIERIVNKQFKTTVTQLIEMDPDEDKIEDVIGQLKQQRQLANSGQNDVLVKQEGGTNGNVPNDEAESYVISDDSDHAPSTSKKKQSKPRARSRALSDSEDEVVAPSANKRRSKSAKSKNSDSDEPQTSKRQSKAKAKSAKSKYSDDMLSDSDEPTTSRRQSKARGKSRLSSDDDSDEIAKPSTSKRGRGRGRGSRGARGSTRGRGRGTKIQRELSSFLDLI